MSVRWFVQCSVKYQRWSRIFRILTLDLWIALMKLIVIAAFSATLIWRHTAHRSGKGTRHWQDRWPTSGLSFLGVFLSGLQHKFPAITRSVSYWVRVKTPIKNLDELFASGIKLAYPPECSFIFVNGDETEVSKVQRNRANCPSYNFVQTVHNIGRMGQLWSAVCFDEEN